MSGWLVLLILGLMVVVSVVIVVVTRRDELRREQRRQRFELMDTGQRVPMADEKPTTAPASPTIAEVATFVAREPARPLIEAEATREDKVLDVINDEADTPPPAARFVRTPDGESLVTSPPFKRRDSIFSKKHGRYAQSLTRRLPPWLVVCPKVRLDTLVQPTSPDGRDADDWREWRRRVRVRAVDLLLVDRRTWEPLLAIMLDREHPTAAMTLGGGKDRIIDEVLAVIDLPLIRGTGSFKDDWSAIRPYVEQAMLPTTEDADREPVMGGAAWDASAVVKLLSFDEERGGLLE